jgi:hypothetical protein
VGIGEGESVDVGVVVDWWVLEGSQKALRLEKNKRQDKAH